MTGASAAMIHGFAMNVKRTKIAFLQNDYCYLLMSFHLMHSKHFTPNHLYLSIEI